MVNYNNLSNSLKKLNIDTDSRNNFIFYNLHCNKDFYNDFYNNSLNLKGGGFDKEVDKKKIKFGQYIFILHFLINTDDEKLILKVESEYNIEGCILVFIQNKTKHAQIENLSNLPDCAKNAVFPKEGGGKILLNFIVNYLKKNKDIYNINKITLTDNSFIRCKEPKEEISHNISLGDIYLLKYGMTWYESNGFIPNRTMNKKYSENNMKIMNTKKVKDYPELYERLKELEKNYNLNKLIEKKKDMLLKDFFKFLFKNVDNFCYIIKEEIINIFIDLNLHSLHGTMFQYDL
jgi:hypothetical protein